MNRPELSRLRGDAEPGDVILIEQVDRLTRSMLKAVNGMMLDMLAAIARKDYEDRRRRQAEGISKAKTEGKYRGRVADAQKHELIRTLRLVNGKSLRETARLAGVSKMTVIRVCASVS